MGNTEARPREPSPGPATEPYIECGYLLPKAEPAAAPVGHKRVTVLDTRHGHLHLAQGSVQSRGAHRGVLQPH